MSRLGEEQTRKLAGEEVAYLLELDGEFFSEELEFFTGTHRRVEQCQYLEALEGKMFIRYVRRVIVPDEIVGEAAGIFAADNMPEVVASSALL